MQQSTRFFKQLYDYLNFYIVKLDILW